MPVLDTYKLKDPVEIEEADKQVRRYTEVNILRKLKGKDMCTPQFNRILSGKILGEDILFFAKIICDVPSHVFDELSAEDILALFERLEPFLFPKGSGTRRK